MMPPKIAFPALLQDFFLRRLIAERGASAHTISSYRDTFELLLRFLEQRTRRAPSALTLQDLDAPTVLTFLDHLETERGNSPRTRNLRLTAIRSFWRYASVRDATSLPIAQRVLAISVKRFDRPALDYLSHEEIKALLDSPDRSTWGGQRDAVLLAVLYNSGARVSEVTGLSPMSSRIVHPLCVCMVKGASSASSRSGRAPPSSCVPGSGTSTVAPTPLCSPTAPATPYRDPESSNACAWRSRRHLGDVPPCSRARSRRTRFDTRRRCIYSNRGSTSPSSPCGSVTRTRLPPTTTSKPTSR